MECSTWNICLVFHVEQFAMSSASAWGFSGWDPLGSFGEGLMKQLFMRKAAKNQLQNAKSFASWSATQGPSLTKQGLINAGYNPMLAVSEGFNMPTFQTTGTFPDLGDTVSGYDPTVISALQTQKAERELLKAQRDKVKAETGALSPLKALVGLVNTPEAKDAFRGLLQKMFSTDGSQNNPEIPPAPTLIEIFKAANKGVEESWSDVGLKQAEHEAANLGLDGKERSKYIENRRRLFNGRKASLYHR